jgi:DNA-binding GntR family transcriptional regulator
MTLTDQITVSLREAILSGDLPAGSRIVVDDLRAKYRASHIPIREAIRRLEAEALLLHVPNQGTHVASLTRSEADELYDVRIIIEPTIALRAVKLRGKSDISAARSALSTLLRADSRSDARGFQRLHRKFHWALLEPGSTPTIEWLLQPIWRRVERYLLFIFADPIVPGRSATHHEELFEAWVIGDEAFADMIRSHLERARESMAAQLATMELPDELSEVPARAIGEPRAVVTS